MAFKKGMELREQAKDLFVANNAVKVSELEFGASRCNSVGLVQLLDDTFLVVCA